MIVTLAKDEEQKSSTKNKKLIKNNSNTNSNEIKPSLSSLLTDILQPVVDSAHNAGLATEFKSRAFLVSTCYQLYKLLYLENKNKHLQPILNIAQDHEAATKELIDYTNAFPKVKEGPLLERLQRREVLTKRRLETFEWMLEELKETYKTVTGGQEWTYRRHEPQ